MRNAAIVVTEDVAVIVRGRAIMAVPEDVPVIVRGRAIMAAHYLCARVAGMAVIVRGIARSRLRGVMVRGSIGIPLVRDRDGVPIIVRGRAIMAVPDDVPVIVRGRAIMAIADDVPVIVRGRTVVVAMQVRDQMGLRPRRTRRYTS